MKRPTGRSLSEGSRVWEGSFRAVMEQFPLGIHILTPDGTSLFSNAAWRDIWDLGEKPPHERSVFEDDQLRAAGLAEYIEECVASGDMVDTPPLLYDPARNRREGNPRWIRGFVQPVKDRTGRVLAAVAIIEDVTEHKRHEDKLKQAEAYFRLLVEQVPAVIYVDDVDEINSAIFRSPFVEEMLGYTPQEFRSEPEFWQKLLHPDDRERVLAENARTNETGEPFRIEYRMIAKDGRVVWLRDEAILVRDEEGEPLYWQGIFIDITERKEAERRLREAEVKYRTLVEQIPAITYVQELGETNTTTYISPQVRILLGYTAEDLVGDTARWFGLVHPADRDRVLAAYERSIDGGEPFSMEYRMIAKDGHVVWLRDEATVMRDEEGSLRFWQGVQIDITEHKRAEEALRESETRHRAVVDSAFDAIITAAEDGVILSFNRRAESIFGYAAEEVVGQPLAILMPERVREPHLMGERPHVEAGEPGRTLELEAQRKDGTVFPIELSIAETREGGRKVFTGIVRDITERRTFEEQLQYQAFHDTLTGLANRALLMDRLEHALARVKRRGGKVAVLFVDLDNFKVINDSLGHEIGDELLIAVGQRLHACLRPEDTAARLGGDEFALLIEGVEGVDDAVRVADRLMGELNAPFALDGRELFTSASIGIVSGGPDQERPRDLLRDADLAMYRAKACGKAQYKVFEEAMKSRVLERLNLESGLRQALAREELRLYYQPKIVLETGRIVGLEALVRWEHPQRGLVLPQEFVPIAEETGLIVPIGHWVLREACRQVREWQMRYPSDPPLTVCVNLSARQFKHPGLVEEVARILRETGLPPSTLDLEIAEDTVMKDAQSAVVTCRELKALGVELTIDNFGTGYSSLSYLRRFPVDHFKIDRSFVEGLEYDTNNKLVVSGVMGLARGMGLEVIAEGVENADQLRHLCELGCNLVQGNHFWEPLGEGAVMELLTTHRSQAVKGR